MKDRSRSGSFARQNRFAVVAWLAGLACGSSGAPAADEPESPPVAALFQPAPSDTLVPGAVRRVCQPVAGDLAAPGTIPAGRPVPLSTVLESKESGPRQGLRCVVRSADAMAAVRRLQGYDAAGTEYARPDFGRHTVLLAAMGTRPTHSHAIQIRRAWLRGDTLYVHVEQSSPAGPGNMDMAVSPLAVVIAPRHEGPVVFVEERR